MVHNSTSSKRTIKLTATFRVSGVGRKYRKSFGNTRRIPCALDVMASSGGQDSSAGHSQEAGLGSPDRERSQKARRVDSTGTGPSALAIVPGTLSSPVTERTEEPRALVVPDDVSDDEEEDDDDALQESDDDDDCLSPVEEDDEDEAGGLSENKPSTDVESSSSARLQKALTGRPGSRACSQ